jgi:hypothetical protein
VALIGVPPPPGPVMAAVVLLAVLPVRVMLAVCQAVMHAATITPATVVGRLLVALVGVPPPPTPVMAAVVLLTAVNNAPVVSVIYMVVVTIAVATSPAAATVLGKLLAAFQSVPTPATTPAMAPVVLSMAVINARVVNV